VPRGGVARCLGGEFGLLQVAVGRHPTLAVVARQIEHRQVEAVEAGEGDELEAVAHADDVALEARELRL
jgi:hypothetical protein